MTSHPPHPTARSPVRRMFTTRNCAARIPGIPTTSALLLALVLGLLPAESGASTAIAKVTVVDGAEVIIDAGQQDGLSVTAKVTLLREGEPIVHPLTGEVLGMPQEPVGVVQIYEVDAHSSRGGLVKMYADPLVGDLAEFEPKVSAPFSASTPEVEQVKEQVEQLSQNVEEYRRRSEQRLGTYPDFARRVLDEIAAMKSYLVSLDERMMEIEEQQNEHHFRLSSVLSGEYRQEDLKEFTIRYAPDTQVRLRAAGKTLMIDVVADSIRMTPIEGEPVSMAVADTESDRPGFLGLFGFGGDAEEEMPHDGGESMEMPTERTDETLPWYTSVYHLAAGIGLILALAIMVYLVIKRRYSDVMDGLDDFDDDNEGYLDDEDDDEDEDEKD